MKAIIKLPWTRVKLGHGQISIEYVLSLLVLLLHLLVIICIIHYPLHGVSRQAKSLQIAAQTLLFGTHSIPPLENPHNVDTCSNNRTAITSAPDSGKRRSTVANASKG